MTEEDTFLRLQRRPAADVFQDVLEIMFAGGTTEERTERLSCLLEKEKWTWEELAKVNLGPIRFD